jgi:CxxC motif-containing protein
VRELTCIVCPMGCRMKVTTVNGGLQVEGNSCRRGENYAKDEITAPKRVVTSAVAVEDATQLLSVKTAAAVPKELIFKVMEEIRGIRVRGNVQVGQVIRKNLAGTGVALVATKNFVQAQQARERRTS